MDEPQFGTTPPPPEPEPAWGAPPPASAVPTPEYIPPAPPPPGYVPLDGAGMSDNAAGALAYITIIPAIIFLLIAPYNRKPFVKFHAIQELGLSVALFVLGFFRIIPFLGLLIYIVGALVLLVMWILCIVKALGGGAFKVPLLGDFAAKQSGYTG
jgi:uncharacterized membrane protein